MICSRASKRAGVAAALFVAATLFVSVAHAAPYQPGSDDAVLERLAPAVIALRKLRGSDAAVAQVKLPDALSAARHYIELGRTYSDPRAYGYAQAALGTWWTADPAPAELLVMRARILQFHHDFDGALAQLEAALKIDQFNADAWLLFASIEQVRGNVRASRAWCLKLMPIADPLIGAVCAATTAALGGHSRQGEQLLARALAQPSGATRPERAWAWTTLAEMRAHGGDADAAEAAFRQALALAPDDVYARAAYADLLLDHDRLRDVRDLLGTDPAQADATLLRAAIAAKRSADADAAALAGNLAQRFTEARERGDRTHLREQARFALEVEHDPAQARDLAQLNFSVQREPADARVLLEAALAVNDVQAAQPVLDWLRETGIDVPRLQSLAQQARTGAAR